MSESTAPVPGGQIPPPEPGALLPPPAAPVQPTVPAPAAAPADRVAQLEERVRTLESRVMTTQLLDNRFFRRAFAVWGHMFAANLVISAIVWAVVAVIWVIMALIFGVSLAAILSNLPRQ